MPSVLVASAIALNHSQRGKRPQCAYVELYNRTVRYEWLDLDIFDAISKVLEITTE